MVDHGGSVLLSHRSDDVRSIASVGKLLLLAELDARLGANPGEPQYRLTRTEADVVADSGLWQHMTLDALSVNDLAVLIASVSDNLATNVLLRQIGLDAVAERARSLGLHQTMLHDRVRDERSTNHPSRLASGTATELTSFLGQCSDRLLDWMALSTDHSMVAGAFRLDPLIRAGGHPGVANKTGTDLGVRCDVGIVGAGLASVSYVLLVNWPAEEVDPLDVMTAMRGFGDALRSAVVGR